MLTNHLLAVTTPETGTSGSITNPVIGSLKDLTGVAFLQSFIPNLITLLLVAGALIFLFMLIWGAIQWISSSGDKQALEGARGRITNAIIGIVILFAAFAIINLVELFFGIKILTLDISPLVIQ